MLWKKLFLKISQYSQLESLFNKGAGFQACNLVKERLQCRWFSVNIAKVLRTCILKNICQRLLLNLMWLVGFRFSKKPFFQTSEKFGYNFLKNDITFMYLTFICNTAQKMTFSIKDFFSKCDQIRRKMRIW